MQSLINSISDFAQIHFFAIWVTIPIILIVCALFSLYRYGFVHSINCAVQSAKKEITVCYRFNTLFFFTCVIYLTFLIFYICLILYGEDFAYYDNSMFTYHTLQGNNYWRPIWPTQGRFFPLGHQEFNFIKYFTQSPAGYHAFPILQLLIVLSLLFIFLNDFHYWLRFLVMIFVMTTPSFVLSFHGLIFPDRNVVFWLIVFLFCFRLFSKSRSRLYFYASLIAIHFLLYYKEPAFLIISGFFITRIFFKAILNDGLLMQKRYHDFIKNNLLDISSLIIVGIFLLFYIAIFLPNLNLNYAGNRDANFLTLLIKYISLDPLLYFFLIIFILRLIINIYFKKPFDLFWDPLAVGIIFYFLAIIYLKLFQAHYTTPVDFIAILYLAWMINSWLFKKKIIISALTAILICFLFVYNVTHSSFLILERKNIISSKVHLVNFLKKYRHYEKHRKINLFMPNASGYYLMELSAFFEFKGLQLAKKDDQISGKENIYKVCSPNIFQDNICIPYEPKAKCFYTEAPKSNDLIVFLSGDVNSKNDLKAIENEADLLFHYMDYFSISDEYMDVLRKLDSISFIERYIRMHKWWNIYLFRAS